MSANEEPKGKIGDGHAAAMWRLGWREIRELGHFQGSNVSQPSELGLYGTATPGEISDNRKILDRDFDEVPQNDSVIDERLRQAEQSRDDHDDRDNSREIDLER
jgi:hypothetical protein